MPMNRTFRLTRGGPDLLGEELTAALSAAAWFEFKPLFLLVHANLRERRAAHGGEEMLRLRTYDKLQSFVQRGLVEKVGKRYRGIRAALAAFAEQTAAEHSRHLLDTAKRA